MGHIMRKGASGNVRTVLVLSYTVHLNANDILFYRIVDIEALRSDCADKQLNLGLHCLHVSKDVAHNFIKLCDDNSTIYQILLASILHILQ